MNTQRFTDENISAYEQDNSAYWRVEQERKAYDYGDYYRGTRRLPLTPRQSLRVALVFFGLALVAFLHGLGVI